MPGIPYCARACSQELIKTQFEFAMAIATAKRHNISHKAEHG
jgi:hypothetical protein